MLKINIGGQKSKELGPFNDWTIVDTKKGADVRMNIMDGPLPFEENSVDAIYTSHTLEHIRADKQPFVFAEMYRILRPEAPIRIVVPDLDIAIRAYVDGNSAFLRDNNNPTKMSCLPDFDICHLASWFFSYFPERDNPEARFAGGHVMAFNPRLLRHYLKKAEFRRITQREFGRFDPLFKGCDFKRYRNCSIYMEAIK